MMIFQKGPARKPDCFRALSRRRCSINLLRQASCDPPRTQLALSLSDKPPENRQDVRELSRHLPGAAQSWEENAVPGMTLMSSNLDTSVKLDTIVQTVNTDYRDDMRSRNDTPSKAKTTRPAQCLKRVPILDAAAEVFCREGFSGASIDEIAAEACVSRQTIYNHYREKEMLFVAVVTDVTNRANAALFSTLAAFPDKPDNLAEELTAFAIDLNRNCLHNQDGKFLRKLIQSEGPRYPHLFEAWREHGPCKIGLALGAVFARLDHQGALRIKDCDLAARQFLALINADLHMITLFGGTPTDEEISKSARHAVDTFLRAYAVPAEASRSAVPA